MIDREKIIKWFKEKCEGSKCFHCGENDWDLNDEISFSVGYSLKTSQEISPQVILTCRNCANMLHFNAVIMGLIKRE